MRDRLLKLYPRGDYSPADNLLVALSLAGYWPREGCKILDFGCGSGRLVAELRQRGFDAHGFDLHDYVDEDSDVPRDKLAFARDVATKTSDTTFSADDYQLPYPDDTFDLIVSNSVLEHTIDLEPVFREIARVTTPEGLSFHVYPAKSTLIEPHLYVPGASRFQSEWYFRLWATLGVRNEFQESMSAAEVARRNVEYSRTGLKYHSRRELVRIGRRFWRHVRFEGHRYNYTFSWRSLIRNRLRALRSPTPLRNLSRTQLLDALLLAEKY